MAMFTKHRRHEISNDSNVVSLRRLEAGYLYLPMHLFVQGAPENEVRRVPSMAWLIFHPQLKTHVVFDLGIRQDVQNCPPAVYERMERLVHADVPQDVIGSLAEKGVDVQSDIDAVIFSHLHYDHSGDPTKFGRGTKMIVGPGATRFVQGPNCYPENQKSHFDSRGFDHREIVELPGPENTGYWAPLGPFPAAHDWFGDGSVYVINSPGHLTGHLNLVVHAGVDEWIYLAGDTAHDCALLHGEAHTAMYTDTETGFPKCAHENRKEAEFHMSLVTKSELDFGLEVILSHDSAWLERNGARFA